MPAMELTLKRVGKFIVRHALLRPGERLVTGVSGGADSLCLLDSLHRLGFRPIVAHLDHGLRPESAADGAYVAEVARRMGLTAVVAREDVRAALKPGMSIEEAARIVRYGFLARVAREHRARTIAVGHTADDQAETVLMHLLRGAGPEGLRGMRPVTSLSGWTGLGGGKGLRLVRPLLEITRRETGEYCAKAGFEPRQDATNEDPSYFRNRLRLELLPLLETYNPAIQDVLLRTGRIMRAESDLLDELTTKAWPGIIRQAGPQALRMRVEGLAAQPEAVKRTLVRRMIHALRPEERTVSALHVEDVLALAGKPRAAGRATLVGGLEAVNLGEDLLLWVRGTPLLLAEYPQMTGSRGRKLDVPGEVRLASGWRLAARSERLTPAVRRRLLSASEGRMAAFDAETLTRPLRLRPPGPGDSLRPLGLDGTVKLSDLFVNSHIPRLARARWPVVVAGQLVVWVAGLRMAHDPRLTSESRTALVLQLHRP